MTEKKREPPRPRIRKREDEPPSSRGGEIRPATMEVEADWLEKDEPHAAPRTSSKSSLPKSGRSPTPKLSADKPPPPRVVPRPAAKEPQPASKPSRSKISQPQIHYRPEPPELPPPPATAARPRGKLPPSIPREEKESVPPPRNRRSKPPPR
jgi:hypothetical protein